MMGFVSSSDLKTSGRARALVIRAVLIGGIVGVLLTLLTADFGRRAVFDTWQRVSPREITTENVVVVVIDDASLEQAGEWPWPRYVTAQLINQIGKLEPKAIGIDIYFTQTDQLSPENFASRYPPEEMDPVTRANVTALPDMDEHLEKILGQTPSVLARVATDEVGKGPEEYFFDPKVEGTPPVGIIRTEKMLASIYQLDGSALGQGFVNGSPDEDGVVRRVPLAVQVGEVQGPGFAMELARIASDTSSLYWDNGKMVAGEMVIPVDENANLQIWMGNIPASAQFSALQVLGGQVPEGAFRDKVVLVGLTASGTFDTVTTPLQSEVSGIMVQAQAVDAILEGQWLSRPISMIALEILTSILLFGLILSAAATLRSWLLWPALGVGIMLPLVSWLALTQATLFFDPVRPLTVGVCAAIAFWITRYALARAELAEQRVRASEQKGELEAARRIQMSMVPGEKTLSRLDHRTEIGAVLEPAKSVGGDFFDAVKIGENLLLFMVGDVTGKGVPAALFMALSKTLSKSNLARAGDGIADAVAALNRDLMDEADDEMGLTLLVGTLDCTTGAVQLINAGHENPMVVHKDGTVDTFAMVGGPPLCVIEFPYPVETINLAEGDTLVVITDGATEAANEADELFGLSGVLTALKAESDGTARSRAKHLAKEVRLFEGSNDPTDDLTIFALRYLGNAA